MGQETLYKNKKVASTLLLISEKLSLAKNKQTNKQTNKGTEATNHKAKEGSMLCNIYHQRV